MMRFIDLLHRWTGGLIGAVLAVLGLTGTLLIHADALFRPAVAPIAHAAPLPEIVRRALTLSTERPNFVLFASSDVAVHRIAFQDGSGAYLDTAGDLVEHWNSIWERPELWLFDLHRYLFMGESGETIVGLCGLIGIGFVITGALLWWRQRRTFAFRLLPKRLSRPAIVRHHRDLGIVLAPLLLLSFITGVAMALKPIGLMLVSPWSSAVEIKTATARPAADPRPATPHPDFAGILATAERRFPDASVRLLSFPKKAGDPFLVRMRQPSEWLPNGRTSLWFSAHDGRLISARAADTLPTGAQILDKAYPLHSGKVGGLAYRLLMSASGLGLTILGSLTVWTFWRRHPARYAKRLGEIETH